MPCLKISSNLCVNLYPLIQLTWFVLLRMLLDVFSHGKALLFMLATPLVQ